MWVRISAAVLVASVFCQAVAFAQVLPDLEPPPLVRFTGALHPLTEKEHGGLPTLTVSIKETKWLFRIAKIEKLTGRTTTGLRLLQSLFPPQLRLTGPEELLSLLQQPEIAGERLILEGRLYVNDRMFFVTAVEGAATKPQQTPPVGFF